MIKKKELVEESKSSYPLIPPLPAHPESPNSGAISVFSNHLLSSLRSFVLPAKGGVCVLSCARHRVGCSRFVPATASPVDPPLRWALRPSRGSSRLRAMPWILPRRVFLTSSDFDASSRSVAPVGLDFGWLSFGASRAQEINLSFTGIVASEFPFPDILW